MTADNAKDADIRSLAIKQLAEAFDIEFTEDIAEQICVFMQAVDVYHERTGSYGQLWKQYGAMNNLMSIAGKTDRMMEYWFRIFDGEISEIHKDSLDDAIDLLNYVAFFIRNYREGNMVGSSPKRPQRVWTNGK